MTFRTKPQYLLPVPKAQSWDLPLVFKRIYKIDYDITIKHLETYPLVESLDRSIKPVVIPSGLFPSASSGRCFSGSGSGSWASLAYAIGRGGAALVYLGSVPAPGGWGLVRVPDSMGWWRFQSSQVQLSLL